jgi:hypothetical protein
MTARGRLRADVAARDGHGRPNLHKRHNMHTERFLCMLCLLCLRALRYPVRVLKVAPWPGAFPGTWDTKTHVWENSAFIVR